MTWSSPLLFASQMLQAMAEENREIGQHDIKIMTSTIEQVEKFLDREIQRCKSWEASNKFIKRLVDKFNFNKIRKQGVGQTTILKFLNGGKEDGTWKQYEIQLALEILNDVKIDRDAVEMFDNRYQAGEFRDAVGRDAVKKENQKEV